MTARPHQAGEHCFLHQGCDPNGTHRDQPARQARHVQDRRDRTRRLRRCAPRSRSPTSSVPPGRISGHPCRTPEPSAAQGHVHDQKFARRRWAVMWRPARTAGIDALPITAAATRTATSARGRRAHVDSLSIGVQKWFGYAEMLRQVDRRRRVVAPNRAK